MPITPEIGHPIELRWKGMPPDSSLAQKDLEMTCLAYELGCGDNLQHHANGIAFMWFNRVDDAETFASFLSFPYAMDWANGKNDSSGFVVDICGWGIPQ